jgi:hypothetical protein
MVRQCLLPFGFLEVNAHSILATVDDLIDVIMKDHRKYIKW